MVKLNSELVKSPSFRDKRGHLRQDLYTYSVSAVDVRGNESRHSETTASLSRKEIVGTGALAVNRAQRGSSRSSAKTILPPHARNLFFPRSSPRLCLDIPQ